MVHIYLGAIRFVALVAFEHTAILNSAIYHFHSAVYLGEALF